MPGPGRARLGKLWRGAAAPIGSHAGLSHRAFAHAVSGVRPPITVDSRALRRRHAHLFRPPRWRPYRSSDAPASARVQYGAVVVDRRVLQAEGAHALYIEGARAWPRRGDAGLGCLSVNSPSRLCHRAKPMQRTRALRKMTMLTIAASTAIQTNEGPQSRHTREPSKSEGDDYWIARTSLWSGRQRQTRMPGDDN